MGVGGVSPDQVSVGVLFDAVPRDAVDERSRCVVRERRSNGKLPAHVSAYLTLGLSLFPDDDYEEAAAKVTGSLDRFGCWDAAWSVPTASAITQARKRLSPKVFGRCSSGPAGRSPAKPRPWRRWRRPTVALGNRRAQSSPSTPRPSSSATNTQ